jgi:hypothetical protein
MLNNTATVQNISLIIFIWHLKQYSHHANCILPTPDEPLQTRYVKFCTDIGL